MIHPGDSIDGRRTVCLGCGCPLTGKQQRVCSARCKSSVRRQDAEARERDRAWSLAWKQRQKTPCPNCGASVDYTRSGELCVECKHEADYGERNRRIVEAWNRGENTAQIAEREGMTQGAVLASIDVWRRVQGRDDIARRRRRHHEAWDYIQRRWNDDGATLAELAVELETSVANVGMMIKSMRDAGVDVKRRLPRRSAA